MRRIEINSERSISIIILLNNGLNWISLLLEYVILLDMKSDTPPPTLCLKLHSCEYPFMKKNQHYGVLATSQ